MELDQWLAASDQRLGVDIKATVALDGDTGQSNLNFNGSNPCSSDVMRKYLGGYHLDIFVSKEIPSVV